MKAITVFESFDFTRGKDVKGSLGVGMWGQIKQLTLAQDRKFSKSKSSKNLERLFLNCAKEKRYDLMDFILDQGLDINSNEHEILRVLAWNENDEVAIHLILKRGANVDEAIKFADAHHEWKTVRRLEDIKEEAEKHIATPVREAYHFERGIHPRASMKIGGINFQEEFTKDYYGIFEEYAERLKNLEGKTINAMSVQYMENEDGKESKSEKTYHRINVEKCFEMGIRIATDDEKNPILLSQWVQGDDGAKYELDLKEKIYVEK